MNARTYFWASAALLAAAALGGCGQEAEADEKQPVPVRVQTIERRAGGGPIRYSGSLEPQSRVDMAFRVGGYVVALGVDKGDPVKKGMILARLRPTDYEQKVRMARAQLAEARAAARLADIEAARAHKLFAYDAISKAELDKLVAQHDSAVAQVEAAAAQLSGAEISLGDTVLRAPMDGVVLARHVEVGKLVAPSEPAITIADTSTIKAVFGAPQLQVERLRVGSPVQIYVGAESESKEPEKLLAAQVTRIAPAADSNGRVFSIEATLPNPDGALRPGEVVSFRVPDGDGDGAGAAIAVPLRAVVRSPADPHRFAVFVIAAKGGSTPARLRSVELGEVVGNSVTVTQGLAAGESVVTVGATLLRDGDETIVIR